MHFTASIVVAAAVLVIGTWACGITTHIEVGHRAISYFDTTEFDTYKEILKNHQDAFQAGKIYGYSFKEGANSRVPVFTVSANQQNAKLGHSLAIGRPFADNIAMLAVSQPTLSVKGKTVGVSVTWTHAGTVSLLSLASLSGDLSMESLTPVTVLEGDRNYGRFGWGVQMQDANSDGVDDVIVTAPFRTSDPTGVILEGVQGAVYVFQGGEKFPKGRPTSDDCRFIDALRPCTDTVATHTYTGSARSHYGQSVAVIEGRLAIGALNMGESEPRQSGAVYLQAL
eukprot:Colp12_sorted_trinity150504_noHs@28241